MNTGTIRPKRPRLGAMGSGLARVAAVAIGAWLAWATPSIAFHNSGLDPQSKQLLARLLDTARDMCSAGDQRACLAAPRVQALGNQLAQAQQACVSGYQEACQMLAMAQQHLASHMQQRGSMGMPLGPTMPSGPLRPPNLQPGREPRGLGGDDPRVPADPAVCQKAQQDYAKCMSDAREELYADPPRFSSGSSLMATCQRFLESCR
jgi:hypothetical protein